jgi:hypothetical protein
MDILRRKHTAGAISGKSKPFVKAVEDLAAKDPSGRLRIHERAGLKSKYLAEIPITDAVEIARDMEQALQAQFGGGDYEVLLCNRDAQVASRYPFSIGGPSKRKNASDDEGAGGKSRQSDRQMLTAVLGKLADAALSSKSNSADDWHRTLELAKALKGDGSDKSFERELLGNLYNNFLVSKENTFDNAMKIIEVSRALQPQIEKEDPTTALINGLVPLVAQIAASRMSGAAPNLNHEQLRQLQAHIDALQQQGAGLPQTAGVSLPHPGESRAAEPQAEVPATSHTPDASPPDPHMGVVDAMTEQFREDIRAGVDSQILAATLIGMIEYNRGLARPHRLFAGLVNATVETYEREFDRFCAAVPELAGDEAARRDLKMALTMILVERHQASQGAEAAGLDQGTADIEAGGIFGEGQAEEEAATDETDDFDSRPPSGALEAEQTHERAK